MPTNLMRLLLLLLGAASVDAGASAAARRMDCPQTIYSSVLSWERYRQQCYRLAIAPGSNETGRSIEVGPLQEGGMFELTLPNPFGPGLRTACPTIVLRMPWSDPDRFADAIAEKASVRQRLVEAAGLRPHRDAEAPADIEVAMMVTRDSALHAAVPAEAASVDAAERPCLGYFLTDGETGRYLGPPP